MICSQCYCPSLAGARHIWGYATLFTGPATPLLQASDPIEFYLWPVDDTIIKIIVDETNLRGVRDRGWERGKRASVGSVRDRGWGRGRWAGVRGVGERRERGRWVDARERGRERCGWGRCSWYPGAPVCMIIIIIHKAGPLLTTNCTQGNVSLTACSAWVCERERAGQLEKEGDVGEVRLALWGCHLQSEQFHSCSKTRSIL